jgi:glycerophosphoryl diester phosphodiesterase
MKPILFILWFLSFDQPWIVAHRGGHQYAPENSLEAIEEAIQHKADIVELDVRRSRDGVFFLMHDSSLKRTTGIDKKAEELTWTELQKLNLLHNGKPTSHKIPSFEEALLRAGNRIVIDIDFKVAGMDARRDAYQLIEKTKMESQVLFFLYDYKEMFEMHPWNPKIKIMPRVYKEEDLEEVVASGLTDIVHVDPSFKNSALLRSDKMKGYRIWINTLGAVDQKGVTDVNAYRDFVSDFSFANVFQTDFPLQLRQALR